MQDMPNSTSNHLKVDLEDILDPDERTNDIEEERRGADHDSEFYDGDRDQDGDSMPLPSSTVSRNNGGNSGGSNNPPGGGGGGGTDNESSTAGK